jgi:surface antigen
MDWLRGTAVMQFRESDWTLVQDTARAVLEEAVDGERRDWRNETTGNRGAIKPILSFDFEGRPCRRLAFLNEAATGARGISTHTLCRQDDGEWKLVLDSEVLP